MFAYIQIIGTDSTIYGHAQFHFDHQTLVIGSLSGMSESVPILIPNSKITVLKLDHYYRWKRIQFHYNNKHYIFLYTNDEETDYFEKNLQATF